MREGPASGHLRPEAFSAPVSSGYPAVPSADGMRSSDLSAARLPVYIVRTASAILSFAEALLRIAAEASNQLLELVGGGAEPLAVGAAQHESHAEIAAAEIGIRADLDIRITFLQPGEILCQGAFGEVAADTAAQYLVAADEAVLQLLEDPLHDARHAGQHVDIADLESGSARDRV